MVLARKSSKVFCLPLLWASGAAGWGDGPAIWAVEFAGEQLKTIRGGIVGVNEFFTTAIIRSDEDDPEACVVPPDYSNDTMRRIRDENCDRVDKVAAADFRKLARHYGSDFNAHWISRVKEAKALCAEAENGTVTEKAVNQALRAWSEYIMSNEECCKFEKPPFCKGSQKRRMEARQKIWFLLALVFLASTSPLWTCGRVSRPGLFGEEKMEPNEWPQRTRDEAEAVSLSPEGIEFTAEKTDELDTKDSLKKHLQRIFQAHDLYSLPGSDGWETAMCYIFAELYSVFGFQRDSVINQFEHLLSLWRTHCAMFGDAEVHAMQAADGDEKDCVLSIDKRKLQKGLEELHNDLLESFTAWRRDLERSLKRDLHAQAGGSPIIPPTRHSERGQAEGKINDIIKAAKEKHNEDAAFLKPHCLAQSVEVAMYLLVWGEGGNIRFVPELICCITDMALCAFHAGQRRVYVRHEDIKSMLGYSVPGSYGREGGMFLDRVVRPIYMKIYREHYVLEGELYKKKIGTLRPGFKKFFPADAANHDDWNELFLDTNRLTKRMLLKDAGTRLFEQPAENRFYLLQKVDWDKSFTNVKTHREIHSLLGAFASTHRVWFLHLFLYFLLMVLLPEKDIKASGSDTLLGGDTFAVRLAAVGLLVPVDAALWSFSRRVVAGGGRRLSQRLRLGLSDGTDTRDGNCQGYLVMGLMSLLRLLCWILPIFTYRWVRQEEIQGSQSLFTPLCTHFVICAAGVFVLLIWPELWDRHQLFPLTPVPFTVRVGRWTFWISVLSIKLFVSSGTLGSLQDATRSLQISLPGRESFRELRDVAFGAVWDRDMIQWFVLHGVTFVMFTGDTLFWFMIGCLVLGSGLVAYNRAFQCDFCLYRENDGKGDSVAAIPASLMTKVFAYSDPNKVVHLKRLVWNRIVKLLRDDDKLQDKDVKRLWWKQPVHPHPTSQQETEQSRPVILRGQSVAKRFCARNLGWLRDKWWPENPEVQWRLEMLARCLTYTSAMDPQHAQQAYIPRPFMSPYFLGQTVLIPHYGEDIMISDAPGYDGGAAACGNNALKTWLEYKFEDEYAAFQERVGQDEDDHFAEWASMRGQTLWRTVEGMMLYEASLECHKALRPPNANEQHSQLKCSVPQVFNLLIAMQNYMQFDLAKFENTEKVLNRFRRNSGPPPQGEAGFPHIANQCFNIAFIKHEQARRSDIAATHSDWERILKDRKRIEENSGAKIDVDDYESATTVYVRGREADVKKAIQEINNVLKRPTTKYGGDDEGRFYSCVFDADCAKVIEEGKPKRVPRLKIELPGWAILGDGKGDNQNHAIVFTRGSLIQTLDMNQGLYFEQSLLLPCAQGEFRTEPRGKVKNMILGLAEHITSDFGSLGDMAAGAETAFGTILQRSYNWLGARMHYGHPDIMNKECVMQQGGVSKATKTVHLSEDIFAGMDLTLRGKDRTILHKEYMHLAKGRDLGFRSILGFFAKLSSGTSEQLLSRQTFRLGHLLALPEALAFYYAHGGFYIAQFLQSRSIPLLTFVWLQVVLEDPEADFNVSATLTNYKGREIAADFLTSQFSWMMILFMIASTVPLVVQVCYQTGLIAAMIRLAKQMITGAPLYFVFQAKIIGNYIYNGCVYGGAKYVATGRGLPTERLPLITKHVNEKKESGLYNDWADKAIYDGARLLAAVLLVWWAGGLDVGESRRQALNWWLASVVLTTVSWIFSPFIFNPFMFRIQWNLSEEGKKNQNDFLSDLTKWKEFFFDYDGVHWAKWYQETQLIPDGYGIRADPVAAAWWAIFISTWYTILNEKLHWLTAIFSSQQGWLGTTVYPPVFASLFTCLIISATGCKHGKTRVHLACVVTFFSFAESFISMFKLWQVGWWKSVVVGILLKYSLLSVIILIVECLFRLDTKRRSIKQTLALSYDKRHVDEEIKKWQEQNGKKVRSLDPAEEADEEEAKQKDRDLKQWQAKKAGELEEQLENVFCCPFEVVKPQNYTAFEAKASIPWFESMDMLFDAYRQALGATARVTSTPGEIRIQNCRPLLNWLRLWLEDWLRLWLEAHRMAKDLAVTSIILVVLSVFVAAENFVFSEFSLHNLFIYRAPGDPDESQAVPGPGPGASQAVIPLVAPAFSASGDSGASGSWTVPPQVDPGSGATISTGDSGASGSGALIPQVVPDSGAFISAGDSGASGALIPQVAPDSGAVEG